MYTAKALCLAGPGGAEGVDLPLLGDGVDALILGLLPLVDDDLLAGLGAGGDGALELLGLADETLRELLLVGEDGVALGVNVGLDVKGPEDARDTKEQAALGDVDTRADATASTKSELITLGVVGVGSGVTEGLEVVLIAVRVELAGLGVARRVHVDSPDVVDNTGVGRDQVTVIVIILGDSVGDSTHDGGGHPAKSLLHDLANVLQVLLVIHGGQTLVTNDAVDDLLGALLNLGVENHGLNESVESAGGGVGASLEEGARDVGSLVVVKALGLLSLNQVLREAASDGAVESVLLGLEPVTQIESLLLLVQLLGLDTSREHEVGEVADDGEEVHEAGSTSLVELGELAETVKELHHLGVIVGLAAPAKDHGGGQRVGVATDVVHGALGGVEDVEEHLLVLEHLVGDVGLGGRDVEKGVHHLAAHAPARGVAHHENAEVTTAESLAEVHLLTMRVHVALLVQELLDSLVARENDHDLGTENQAVDWAIFTSPLLELKMSIPSGHLSCRVSKPEAPSANGQKQTK